MNIIKFRTDSIRNFANYVYEPIEVIVILEGSACIGAASFFPINPIKVSCELSLGGMLIVCMDGSRVTWSKPTIELVDRGPNDSPNKLAAPPEFWHLVMPLSMSL